jgi:hypothetical protein
VPRDRLGRLRRRAHREAERAGAALSLAQQLVYALHNLADEAVEIELREPDTLVSMLSREQLDPLRGRRHVVELEPFGYRWYRAGQLNYLAQRREY